MLGSPFAAPSVSPIVRPTVEPSYSPTEFISSSPSVYPSLIPSVVSWQLLLVCRWMSENEICQLALWTWFVLILEF
jgi:hypothetical protein